MAQPRRARALASSAAAIGYLRVGETVTTTYYDDLPAASTPSRRFGTGYVERILPARPVSVRERVYAPVGGDPVVLHDVILRNHTRAAVEAEWYEPWGVNPVQQLPANRVHRGIGQPAFDGADAHRHDARPAGHEPLDGVRLGRQAARSAGSRPTAQRSTARAGAGCPTP